MQINFNGTKTIDRVVVYTSQTNYTAPVEPTDSQTSTIGLTDFTVQGWDGAGWVVLASVSGNTLVKRTVTFPPYSTAGIRIHVTKALASESRIAEVEAWTSGATGTSGAAGWSTFGRDAQHTAQSTTASQPLNRVVWQTQVDLQPQYSGNGSLLVHYGSPLMTQANTVIAPVKTGAAAVPVLR